MMEIDKNLEKNIMYFNDQKKSLSSAVCLFYVYVCACVLCVFKCVCLFVWVCVFLCVCVSGCYYNLGKG